MICISFKYHYFHIYCKFLLNFLENNIYNNKLFLFLLELSGRNGMFMNFLDTGRISLRKHAYSNIMKISPPKTESFQIKNSDVFHISAQNIDCGYSLEPPLRGGSNEYPQSMVLSRNKKNNAYPCKPQFYYIKVGFKGVKMI